MGGGRLAGKLHPSGQVRSALYATGYRRPCQFERQRARRSRKLSAAEHHRGSFHRWAGCSQSGSTLSENNLARNVYRGPSVFNTDLSMFKNFPVQERMNLQLRFEAFNVFNIQNYDVPATLTINSNATQIAAGAGRVNGLAQGTTPRQMQFGLRFVF